MARSLKTRTALGVGVLFLCLLAISVVSYVFVNRLSGKTEALLTANYQSILHCDRMMHALEDVSRGGAALQTFEASLRAQEKNITEPGEGAATARARAAFETLKNSPADTAARRALITALAGISRLNERALDAKNTAALRMAEAARTWVALIGAVTLLLCFSLAVNFPGYIARPVGELAAGIREIASKNYSARIHLDAAAREFVEVADAFNNMAERLYAFENSNLAKLRFEKQRVETVINQLEDAVLGVDAAGRILFINRAAEDLFYLRAAEVVGRAAPDVAKHNDLLRTVLRKGEAGRAVKIVVDGKEQYFIASVRAVAHEGTPLGEVYTLKNVTEFKELDLSKTALLSTISHELKTPIASIKLGLKLLQTGTEGALTGGQQELAAAIGEDADRLLKITGELLNLTQIETGHVLFNPLAVAPARLVRTAADAVTAIAREKNVTLAIHAPDDLPLVTADEEKTGWVLINFLTNAVRHSPPGSAVQVAASRAEKAVRFSVTDAGPGIPPTERARVFQKYFQSAGSGPSGSGLGLAICKEFIEAQGGRVGVESEGASGATFWAEMPVG